METFLLFTLRLPLCLGEGDELDGISFPNVPGLMEYAFGNRNGGLPYTHVLPRAERCGSRAAM